MTSSTSRNDVADLADAPCPRGCCVMAEEKDVRAILAAIEREEGSTQSARKDK
jgi:hypothetical protein